MPLTAAQLIIRACTIAKAPGYTVQAGQYLNMLLDTLQQTYDFDYIRKTQTIVLNGNPGYDMATDHQRTDQVYYSVNGTKIVLNQIPIEDYNSLFMGAGVSNYPSSYAVDVSTTPNTILFYPPPLIPLTVSVLYFPRLEDIENPETSSEVPWFENQEYLLKKLAALIMLETDDERAPLFDVQSEKLLRNILTMQDDKGGYAQTIKLDRRSFRSPDSLKPDKAFPLS